jgi:hypothetical protein
MQFLIHDKISPIPHKEESKFIKKIECLISKNVEDDCIERICVEPEINHLDIIVYLKTDDQPQNIQYIIGKIFLIITKISSIPFKKITISSLPLDLSKKIVITNVENTLLFELDEIRDRISKELAIKGVSKIESIKQFPSDALCVFFSHWTDKQLVKQSQISEVYKRIKRTEVESLISRRNKSEFMDNNFLLENRISNNPDLKAFVRLLLIAMLYIFTGKIISNPFDIPSSMQHQKDTKVLPSKYKLQTSNKNQTNSKIKPSSKNKPSISSTNQTKNDENTTFYEAYKYIGGSFVLLMFILWMRKEFFDKENMEDKLRLSYIKYALELYKDLEKKSNKD